MISIDLNSDLGESYGRWTLGDDAAMVQYITSANLACGFHAGDFAVIDATVALCKRSGVGVGAQPSYPDLQGFGRRSMQLSPTELEQCVLYQIGALYGFCRGHQVELQHVKPHGALYNQAAAAPDLARAIARAVARFSRDLPLVGLASSTAFTEAASEAGLPFVAEAFADRRYNPDGTLVSRAEPDALLGVEEAAEQAALLAAERAVIARDGSRIAVAHDTICIHADMERAVERLRAIRQRIGGHR